MADLGKALENRDHRGIFQARLLKSLP